MTRANLYVTLSDGIKVQCVCDSTSAPEQGFIVETIILPLLRMRTVENEWELLKKYCTMDELRTNADYRYTIDLRTKEIGFFDECYYYKTKVFRKGADLTERYSAYLKKETDLEKIIKRMFYSYSNRELIDRANGKGDFNWDDEGVELYRRWRVSAGAFDYKAEGDKLIILKNNQ